MIAKEHKQRYSALEERHKKELQTLKNENENNVKIQNY